MDNKDFFKLSKKAQNLPQKPGVYFFLDKDGKPLYIGKAKELKKRVVSYFAKSDQLSVDKHLMLSLAKDLKTILTDNETEALLLEANLIKKHRPRYNVRLKDDKSYQFIKIDYSDDFPKIYTVRRITDSRSQYFGPFTNGFAVKRTLELLKKLFPYRDCQLELDSDKQSYQNRACLKFYIKKCLGPCIGKVEVSEYNELIKNCSYFLEGKTAPILKDLRSKMREASKEKLYEEAACYRDQIKALEQVRSEQKIVSSKQSNQDYISILMDHSNVISLIIVREGKIVGQENFVFKAPKGSDISEILSLFVVSHYQKTLNLPETIIAEEKLDFEIKRLKDILKSQGKKIGKLQFEVSKTGKKKKILNLGLKNAKEFLRNLKQDKSDIEETLKDLKDALKLPSYPQRIEGYDISNIQGKMAVGSMVVFINGKPDKNEYRRFKIKTVKGANDVAMLKEVLRRRLLKLEDEKRKQPDLILLDGGKGQLNAGLAALNEGDFAIPIIAIAKREEEVFVGTYSKGFHQKLILSKDSEVLKLFQRIRDEAHRFAISYHKILRKKKAYTSALDEIEGIGPKTKKKLLQVFGSVEGIRKAKESELQKVVNKKIVQKIKESL